MPTQRERDYYRMGYEDGMNHLKRKQTARPDFFLGEPPDQLGIIRKPKRKLSAWNKYVKANSKKPRFRYRNGKLNLKKMAVAFRKTPAGRKKK